MFPRVFVVAMWLAILSWSPVIFAGESYSQLLDQADRARSADPAAFRRLLTQLNAETGNATALQRQYTSYLNAYAEGFAGRLNESIRQARQLLNVTSDPGLKVRVGALIVNDYALNGHFNDGLRQLEQTFSLLDQVSDPSLREHLFIAATTLYNQIGQYELAKHYAELVIAAPSSARSLCFAGYSKFQALLKLNALPQSDAPILEVIKNCGDQHESVMENVTRVILARKWISEGQSEKAIALLNAHLSEAQATGYPRAIAEVRSLLAELLLQKGDLAGAETNAQITAVQGVNIANTPPVVSALFTLYKIADQRGHVADALSAYVRYAEAERSYLEEVKARELAYHLVRQEAQQKNQQIELLNRQNKLLQLQQQVDQKAAQNSRFMMMLAVLGALTIAYWGYKTRRLQASLRRMAETDALTSICNRHHFTIKSEQSLAQCAKAGEHAALIMFDLDHFKLINDSYGHATGDWVLVRVAAECSAICRQMDHLGRVGGEEFAILLHGCDLKAATRIAEDCRVCLSRIDTSESGYSFPISASFGVSATSMSGHDLDKLCSHADQMLYRAKREGRNRVRSYAPDQPIELKEAAAHDAASQRVDFGFADGEPFGTLSA